MRLLTNLSRRGMRSQVTTLKPLNDLVMIKPDAPQDRTQGGIWIPKEAQDVVHHGRVKRIGPKVKDLRPRDRVVFDPREGFEVKLDGKDFRVLKQEHIDYVLE
jgi:chaperonin GroES